MDVHQLSNEAQNYPIDNFCKFLKTTRKKEIERRSNEWKFENNKKSITKKDKENLIKKIPPTSIYDCLYRLRTRANYENADTFIFSNISDHEVKKFHKSLQQIVWMSAFFLETISAKYISHKNYFPIIESYKNMMQTKTSIDLPPFDRYNYFKERIK